MEMVPSAEPWGFLIYKSQCPSSPCRLTSILKKSLKLFSRGLPVTQLFPNLPTIASALFLPSSLWHLIFSYYPPYFFENLSYTTMLSLYPNFSYIFEITLTFHFLHIYVSPCSFLGILSFNSVASFCGILSKAYIQTLLSLSP